MREKIHEFEAIIQNGGEKWPEAACVSIPFSVEEVFGTKGQVKVRATFDGEPYRGSIANMGTGHILILRNDIRAAIEKSHGDTVTVTIQKDTEERIVEVPAELQTLLHTNSKAEEFFNSLSYTNRKEYALWITSAKKQETKDRRLEKTIEMLLGGVKHP
ncbi:YdeI/OmpD-associated family protein [Roseivirga sp.]|uniref:YdeI/OmpD-associated family protein n=1 Tax=Roseivirga sp. TaxID=1964215 RepID=UPI002B27BE90|nr:YdeI/OmpD-associated family protein [Roseivirga sp.]